MDGKFDDLLLGLAQKHRGIDDVLYTITSFYERRTDLFHVKDTLEDKQGFKAGEAEDMLRKQFNTFQARYLERAQPHLLMRRGAQGTRQAPPAAVTPATASTSSSALSDNSSSTAAQAGADGAGGPPTVLDGPASSGFADRAGVAAAKGGGKGAGYNSIPDGVNASPLEGGDPGQWERDTKDTGNCRWNQTVTEINVEVSVEACTKALLKVDIGSKKICVKHKGEVVLEGNIFDKINVEESTWHLEDGKRVVLSLEKIKSVYWEALFAEKPAVVS